MGQDIAALALDQTDPVALREERLKKLEELHPRDYIVYAYSALARVAELLLEQRRAEALTLALSRCGRGVPQVG